MSNEVRVPLIESIACVPQETANGAKLVGLVMTFECGCRVHSFCDPADVEATLGDMLQMFTEACERNSHYVHEDD